MRRFEGREPEEVVGKELPTPSTFEQNKDYVARVLFDTADKRLIANGMFDRIGNLARDWPSFSYQRVVNAEGAPSEQAVRLRIESAGQELIRADQKMAQRAAEIRVNTLDAEKAPNTVPAEANKVTPLASSLASSATSQGRI